MVSEVKVGKDLEVFLDKKSEATNKLVNHFSRDHNLGMLPKHLTNSVNVRNKKMTLAMSESFSKLREEASKICGIELTFAEIDWLVCNVLGPIAVEVSKEKKKLPAYTMYTMLGIELSDDEKRSLAYHIEGGTER